GLDQLRHLVQNGLGGGGVGDLVDLDDVLALHIPVPAPELDGAPAGAVDLLQSAALQHHLSPGGKVRGQEGGADVAVGVLQVGHRGVADLREIEAAQLAGHAHGNALVGGDQDVGEGGGQQGRLLHGVVVVVHEVHRVLVQVPEE